jgi:preprotein translocase subunit SecD
MKTLNLMIIIFLFVMCSGNSGVSSKGKKVTFGIHEVVNTTEIPTQIIDTLKTRNMQPEKNIQLSIVGYILKADSSILQLDLSKKQFKLIKMLYPVDRERKYYAVVAIKPIPAIEISDIQNTKPKGNAVEIYFTMKGAHKWADLTKNMTGRSVAFVIDNQVYNMPLVQGEIRNGAALINGLENEDFAKSISESLNSSIPK